MNRDRTPSDLKQLAHDVNGLMACAQLSIDRLAHDDSMRGKARAADHIQSVIDKTVDYCRLVMMSVPGEAVETTNVNKVAQSVVALLRPLASQADVGVLLTGYGEKIRKNDADILHRLLLNLGRNSLSAMAQSGGGKLSFRIWGTSDRLWIDVSDTGPGLDCVSRAFFEAPADVIVVKKNGRARLGLQTSRALATRLGGHLELIQTGAAGTVIRIALPRM